jgi:DNA-binding Lrp family transcriptional regulator
MKNLKPKLIELLKSGECTPRISILSKKLHTLSTTIHYNIKSMEKEGMIKSYKAVFDYKKIGEGFCTFVLINLDSAEYKDPQKIAEQLAKYDQIESVDIITGQWELLVKVRTKSIEDYYEFARQVLSLKGIAKTQSMNSLMQVKTEFVVMKK